MLKGDTVWKFGQNEECNLRVKRPGVADYHCHLIVASDGDEEGDEYTFKLESNASTYLNGTPLPSTPSKTPRPRTIRHGDIITIPNVGGRQFRIEYPHGHRMRRRSKRSFSKSSSVEAVKVVDDKLHVVIPKIETPKTGSIKKQSEVMIFV